MGWLDRAKKLAEQAKDKAEEAIADARARSGSGDGGDGGSAAPGPVDERMGTPYVPGMLGIRGWREQGLPDPAAGPEAIAVQADRQRALQTYLCQLPPDQQRAIELRLAGLTGPEIAAALDRPHDAVRALLLRATKRLRTLFGIAPAFHGTSSPASTALRADAGGDEGHY